MCYSLCYCKNNGTHMEKIFTPSSVVGNPLIISFHISITTISAKTTRCVLHNSRVGLSIFPPAENSPSSSAHHIVLLLRLCYCFFLWSDTAMYLLLLQLKQSHPSSQSLELRTLWTGSKLCSFGDERGKEQEFFVVVVFSSLPEAAILHYCFLLHNIPASLRIMIR